MRACKESRDTVVDRLRHSFDPRADNRDAARHRFQHDHWQSFADETRQDERVQPRQLGGDIVHKADPIDVVLDVQLGGLAPDAGFVFRCLKGPDGSQADGDTLSPQGRQRLQENFQSLPRPEQRDSAECPDALGRRRVASGGSRRGLRSEQRSPGQR